MGECNDIAGLLKDKWGDRTPRPPAKEKASAVLIPLIKTENGWEILFERRALTLDVQPGDICLPGGGVEDGESHREAAIREACEELLITSSSIDIIAPMDGVFGPGERIIWPFLGVLRDYRGTFSRDEVDSVFTMPVKWFFENEPSRHITWMENHPKEDFPYELIYGGRNYKFRKRPFEMLFFENGRDTIWGATARVINAFLQLCRESFNGPGPFD
ncbi:MAG: CoA pyrophosphatase [Eubacterium sp.]|nr:CoA pyrophosphatase [Eubacterium sp.]